MVTGHPSFDPAFARRISESFPERGPEWLAGLPRLVDHYAAHWGLTVEPPFVPLSYNYVAPATRADGSPAVLKLGVPHAELLSELAALRHYDGRGAVRLLESDAENGAMLLERLLPGDDLTSIEDDAVATRLAAGVMRTLWRPPAAGHSFRTTADWGLGFQRHRARFDGGTGPLSPALVDRAEEFYFSLESSAAPGVVLHGDLHHFNILATGEGWAAIDPKGIIGEPAYETGALLRNPNPALADQPGAAAILQRRIEILSDELGFDRQRVRSWAFAQAVLSAIWSVEDHGSGYEFAIAVAELLMPG